MQRRNGIDKQPSSPSHQRRAWFHLPLALAPYALLAALLIRKTEDFDTWFHLGVGRWILQHRRVPFTDPFSWTAADRPYIDSHWFFQTLIYPLFSFGGMPSLVILQATVFVAAFWILSRSLPEDRPFGAWEICLALAILNTSERFLLRPETLTFLFMAVFWQRLFRAERSLKMRDAALLAGCQVVWLNVHGLFLFGLVFYACYAAGAVAARRLPLPEKWRAEEDLTTPGWMLGVTGGIIAAACVVSPYGTEALRYAWLLYAETRHATGRFMPTVAELASPYHVYQLQPTLLAFYALSVLTAISLILNWRRLRLSGLLLVGAFFALAQLTIRNTAYFTFVAAPFCAQNLIAWAAHSRWVAGLRARRPAVFAKPALAAGVLGAVAWGVWTIVSDRYYIATEQTTRFGWQRSPYSRVEDALRFAEQADLQGRYLNDILFGGPALWHWAPRRKLFVDGRLEVYGEEFLTDYKGVMDTPEGLWDGYVKRYDLEYAVLSVLSPYSRQLVSYLRKRPDWPLLYADDSALVFGRGNGINRERIRSIPSVTLPTPESGAGAPALAAGRQGRSSFWRQPYPFYELSMGRLALLLGESDLAVRWNQAALAIWPDCTEALFNLGTIYFDQKNLAEAERYNRAVLERRPHDVNALAALGGIALQRNQFGEARKLLKKAAALKPGLAAAWSALGLIALQEGQNERARDELKRAVSLGAADSILHNNLGVAYYRLNEPKLALEQFRLALEIDPLNTAALQARKMLTGS